MADGQPLKSARESWVVPPGLRSFFPLFAALNSLRKNSSRRKKHTSGAEAQTHFQRLNGTSKLVPFPKPALVGVFPQV